MKKSVKIKTIITCGVSLLIAIIVGAYELGINLGSVKYDQEKNNLYEQNVTCDQHIQELRDSLMVIKSQIPKTANSSIAKKKELIVYNNTSENRLFRYRDKAKGSGEGGVISPKQHISYILRGTVYDYGFYGVNPNEKGFYDVVDTLNQGEFIMRIPRKEVIVINE